MKNEHANIDSVYFEALDRIRHDVNRIRQQPEESFASTMIATLSQNVRPSIHRVELATVMDLGAVFFAYEGNEAHCNIIRNPALAMYISQATPTQDIIIEGAVRELTKSESDVAWYRQPQNVLGLRPKEHLALLLTPERIVFTNRKSRNNGSEYYAPGPEGLWQKECHATALNQVA